MLSTQLSEADALLPGIVFQNISRAKYSRLVGRRKYIWMVVFLQKSN